MNNRKYYEELFADYKDLVSFNEFRTMLMGAFFHIQYT